MTTFALISEGLTDQIILERIIEQICAKMFEDDVDINPLQPLRDATDTAAAPHAGWELVFEYCRERAADALAANDYVVIHLDTDQGDHPNFRVPLTYQGADRPYNDLVENAIAVIAAQLGGALYPAHAKRFLFAISVHSMESWLLLCLFDRDEPKNSMDRLNHQLRIKNRKPLVKEVRAYQQIARDIKRKRLMALSVREHSFGLFLVRLCELITAAGEES
jgi:hypothetical protein